MNEQTRQAPNKPINSLKTNTDRWLSISSLFISLFILLFGNNITIRISDYFEIQHNQTTIEGIIAIINIVLCSYVFIDLWFIHPVVIDNETETASESFKQLLKGWKLLWLTWILLYICLGIQWFGNFGNSNLYIFWSITTGINLINGFFFYYLFFVLDQPSVSTEREPDRAESFLQNCWITGSIGLFIFLITLVGYYFKDSIVELAPTESWLLDKLVPAYIAVGMAFLFGRLDSHYLKLPRIVLAPLYFYSIIQLYWEPEVVSNQTRYNRVAIFTLALVLKLMVFINLSKLFRQENFRKYFIVAEKGLKED